MDIMATRCCKPLTSHQIISGYGGRICNGPADRPHTCSATHDCCGDRVESPCCTENCPFCGQNDGWCSYCLAAHSKVCAGQVVTNLKAQLQQKSEDFHILARMVLELSARQGKDVLSILMGHWTFRGTSLAALESLVKRIEGERPSV